MSLRCSLLNCQGLISRRTNKLQTEEFRSIFSSSDIVLLTETWTDRFSEISVSNFEPYILNRETVKNNCKRNTGGLIIYIRDKYVSKETLVYKSEDDIIWVKLNKSVISLNEDLYICLCYVTPDDSSRQTLVESNIFDRLLESVLYVENKGQKYCNILICGDFNARSSIKPDFVVDDDDVIHMPHLPNDYSPDMYLQRFSEDQGHTNNNGNLLLDFCKQTGLRIMNGRVGNDYGIGKYTFVGHRGRSVDDYVLAKPDFFNFINSFDIHEPNILSDHCLIKFVFEFGTEESQNIQFENSEMVQGKYKWNSDLKAEFIERLEHDTTTHKLSSLNEKITQCTSPVEIDACLTDFVEIIDFTAKPFFKKFRNNDQNSMIQDIPVEKEQPWYNNECKEKKFTFLYMLDKFRDNKTDENRKNMVKARSEYKKLILKCRYNYDKGQTNKFLSAKYTNAKLYWNMLKELSNVKPANIPLSYFEQYFKSVNNPDDPFYAPMKIFCTSMKDILKMNLTLCLLS